MGLLAYHFHQPEHPAALEIRIRKSEEHLQSLHPRPLSRTHAGDGLSGFVGWQPEEPAIDWEFLSVRENTGNAWLHVPSIAGGPEHQTDAWGLADAVLTGSLHQAQLGAPFALVRWQAGTLQIVNDMLGLVRLFHYEFDNGHVWCTRQGLAHIFMGRSPARNSAAWAGMATLGWATLGQTQLGFGKHLPGGSHVIVRRDQGTTRIEERNTYSEWLESTRLLPRPSMTETAQDMQRLISTAKRWPAKAIADLSGGKDSRVSAALGIRSNAIDAVRTYNTDRGEVETARRLMELVDTSVEHRVLERPSRVVPGGNFLDRVVSQHRAYEGRFLAATAVNAAPFSHFRSAPRAKFNGLGGEVLAGGNFSAGVWRDRMIGAPVSKAGPRLAKMVALNRSASSDAKDATTAQTEDAVQFAKSVGATTAGEALDIFYSRDKMPNWSVTFATNGILYPLFSPCALTLSAHTMGAPAAPGDLHRELLRAIIPTWADVPFYKPNRTNRSTPYIWEDADWDSVRSFVRENASSEAFDQRGIEKTLELIAGGHGARAEEIDIFRLLWDRTFGTYVAEIATIARDVDDEIARMSFVGQDGSTH